MDVLSPSSSVERAVFMKGAQLGGTECGNNWIGYIIQCTPAPVLLVEPTLEMARRLSRQRIQAMVDSTPALQKLVKPPRERDSGNTLLSKEFLGGILIMAGANSAVGLRSMPTRFLFLDEVDAFPLDVEEEGSPLELAIKRTSTFARKKILMVSTPTIKGASVIESEYEQSDKRKYHVPCPHCNHFQPLVWSNIKWDKDDPSTVTYLCSECGVLIEEYLKPQMLEQGKWVAENPESEVAGFHLNSLYSPLGWQSWSEIVRDFLKAQKDSNLLKTFVNTVLAETWEEEAEQLDPVYLTERRETYKAAIPDGVLVLTCGVDTQKDRLEATVIGWGEGYESWVIEHRILYGDPGQEMIWDELDLFLQTTYEDLHGNVFNIITAGIDSGGHFTQSVYNFVKPRQGRRIYAFKGSSQRGKPIVSGASKHNLGKVNLYSIGTDTAKDVLYSRLKIASPDFGYIHFPDTLKDEYFKQLTAEKIITKHKNGYPYREYNLPGGRKNETLDCFIYNIGALTILNPNFSAISRKIYREDEVVEAATTESVAPAKVVPIPPKTKTSKLRNRITMRNTFTGRR